MATNTLSPGQPLTRAVGQKVRALRLSLGMTQYELAKAADVREVRISEIENARTPRYNPDHLAAIAVALGTTSTALLAQEPVPVRLQGGDAKAMTVQAQHVTVIHVIAESAASHSTYADVR